MWVTRHCLRTVNGTEFTCLSRHKHLSSVHMAKLCRATQSFPSQLCFPRTHSRRTCGSIPQRDKTDLSSSKGSRDVYFYSLAQIPSWSQQMTCITWWPSHFSTLKICAVLQGRASQLGSIAGRGCTVPIGSALPLPLSPHLQSPGPASLWPQASVQLHHWCMLLSQGGRDIFTFKSSPSLISQHGS